MFLRNGVEMLPKGARSANLIRFPAPHEGGGDYLSKVSTSAGGTDDTCTRVSGRDEHAVPSAVSDGVRNENAGFEGREKMGPVGFEPTTNRL